MEKLVSQERLRRFVMPPFRVLAETEVEKRQLIEHYLHLPDHLNRAGLNQCGVYLVFDQARVFLGPKVVSKFECLFGIDWSKKDLPMVIGSSIQSFDGEAGPSALLSLIASVNALSESMPNGLLHQVFPMKKSVARAFRDSYYSKEKGGFYFYNYHKPVFPVETLPANFGVVKDDLLKTIELAREYFGERWMVKE